MGYPFWAPSWGLPLDAVVVGAPLGDGLFDGLGLEVLGEGFVDEGR